MSFVCEYIPEQDIARYGLKALWQEYGYDFPKKAEWVRDREHDLYLVRLGNLIPKNPDEDWMKHHEIRIMYWNGQKTVVRLLCTDKDNRPQGLYYVNCWSRRCSVPQGDAGVHRPAQGGVDRLWARRRERPRAARQGGGGVLGF